MSKNKSGSAATGKPEPLSLRPVPAHKLRYERPSPHTALEHTLMEQQSHRHLQLGRASAQAADVRDAISSLVQALESPRVADAPAQEAEAWLHQRHGSDPYTEAIPRPGSAFEGPSATERDLRRPPASAPVAGTAVEARAEKAKLARTAVDRQRENKTIKPRTHRSPSK